MSVLAEQWRAGAAELRKHAAYCERMATQAEARGDTLQGDIVRLLHECDGQLGLAIHRGLDIQWKEEAESLITRIRKATAQLGGQT